MKILPENSVQVKSWSLTFWRNTSQLCISVFISMYCGAVERFVTGDVSHFFFFFLWFFLLSLHSVGDQIGAAPVTCHRNVPALLSISGSTRAGRAVACCRPQTAPGGSSTLTWRIGLGCACACVGVQINTQVCAHVYEASTQPVAPSRDKTCPALFSGLCDVCGLDRAFQRAHHQPGRKRGIWHVSTGIPVTWEMCPAGT